MGISAPRRAVFLDRDGVIVSDTSVSAGAGGLYEGAAEAIASLNADGWLVVVVTNQPAVGHGVLTEDEVRSENNALAHLVESGGGHIDAVYFCPHHPVALLAEYRINCQCRKPRPGMLLQAQDELDIDMPRSAMVGDRITDLEAGRRAGCGLLVLVESGAHTQGRITTHDPPLEVTLDAAAGSLADAAAYVRSWGLSSRSLPNRRPAADNA